MKVKVLNLIKETKEIIMNLNEIEQSVSECLITEVIFRIEDGKPIAFFPKVGVGRGKISCYTIESGHSSAQLEYVRQCLPAKTEQILPLYNHLVSIGYKLKVKTLRGLK